MVGSTDLYEQTIIFPQFILVQLVLARIMFLPPVASLKQPFCVMVCLHVYGFHMQCVNINSSPLQRDTSSPVYCRY